MLAEGLLDDQFSQLQQLQDESNPDFVEEVVLLFFNDSKRLLDNLTESLKTDPIDYKVVDSHVHQFKGSSSRFLIPSPWIGTEGFEEDIEHLYTSARGDLNREKQGTILIFYFLDGCGQSSSEEFKSYHLSAEICVTKWPGREMDVALSIGAQRVTQVCITFRHCCHKEDKEGCLDALEKVKEEYEIVRGKLETMLELEKQIVAAGGTLPFVEECW